MNSVYRLSVDEVAMALSQVGFPEAARGLLVDAPAVIDSDELLRGRLISAGHSLIARGLFSVGASSNVTVQPGLGRLLEPLAEAKLSLRVSRISDGPEEVASFHFAGGVITRQTIDREVVYELSRVESMDEVTELIGHFFDACDIPACASDPFDIPAIALDEMQETADVAVITQMLVELGVPLEDASLFAEDFVGVEWRGAILRVDYDGAGAPRSDRGSLILKGPKRARLMRVDDAVVPATLSVRSLTMDLLREEIVGLVLDDENAMKEPASVA